MGTKTFHLFTIVFGCFYITMVELCRCNKDHSAHKAYNIDVLAFYRKSFPIPGLRHAAMASYLHTSLRK